MGFFPNSNFKIKAHGHTTFRQRAQMTHTATKRPEESNQKNSTRGPLSRSQFQQVNFITNLQKKKKKERAHEMGEQIHQLKETSKSKLQQWHISPQCEWASSMSLQAILGGEGLEKRKASKVLVRWNWKQPLNRTVCRCLKGKQSSPWTSSQCLKEYPGKIRIQKEICTQICSALPVTTAKIWKQSIWPDECMKRTATCPPGAWLSRGTEWNNNSSNPLGASSNHAKKGN